MVLFLATTVCESIRFEKTNKKTTKKTRKTKIVCAGEGTRMRHCLMGAENWGGKLAFLATNFRGKSRNTFSVASDLMGLKIRKRKSRKNGSKTSMGDGWVSTTLRVIVLYSVLDSSVCSDILIFGLVFGGKIRA